MLSFRALKEQPARQIPIWILGVQIEGHLTSLAHLIIGFQT
jgi:hypothetical protein